MAVPIPVGIGLIRRGDCFLIRRCPAGTAMAGYWEFPGGKCEPSESPEAATRRECLEETGLAVNVGSLRRVIDHEYPHARVELFYHDCETREPGAEPDRASGFVWVPASELPGLTFPEANGPILTSLAREYPASS